MRSTGLALFILLLLALAGGTAATEVRRRGGRANDRARRTVSDTDVESGDEIEYSASSEQQPSTTWGRWSIWGILRSVTSYVRWPSFWASASAGTNTIQAGRHPRLVPALEWRPNQGADSDSDVDEALDEETQRQLVLLDHDRNVFHNEGSMERIWNFLFPRQRPAIEYRNEGSDGPTIESYSESDSDSYDSS